MSEKVLGFKRKDAYGWSWLVSTKTIDGENLICFPENKLVPVNLKSESVTVKWLEKEGNQLVGLADASIGENVDERIGYKCGILDLLSAVRKQSKAVDEKE